MSTLDKNAGLSCAAMSKPRKAAVVSTADLARWLKSRARGLGFYKLWQSQTGPLAQQAGTN
jgi:hypothetical protein